MVAPRPLCHSVCHHCHRGDCQAGKPSSPQLTQLKYTRNWPKLGRTSQARTTLGSVLMAGPPPKETPLPCGTSSVSHLQLDAKTPTPLSPRTGLGCSPQLLGAIKAPQTLLFLVDAQIPASADGLSPRPSRPALKTTDGVQS